MKAMVDMKNVQVVVPKMSAQYVVDTVLTGIVCVALVAAAWAGITIGAVSFCQLCVVMQRGW